jgi:hypothetical protein
MANGSCPDGECLQGFEPNGDPICVPCGGRGCDEATTSQIGMWCVDNNIRGFSSQDPPKNFADASAECHAEGMSICPVEALMLCDLLNDAAGPNAQCSVITDQNNVRLWTSTFDASYGEHVFASIVTYGENNRAFKALATDSYPFYCCKSAK